MGAGGKWEGEREGAVEESCREAEGDERDHRAGCV